MSSTEWTTMLMNCIQATWWHAHVVTDGINIPSLNGGRKATYQEIDVVVLVFEVLHQLLKTHRLWTHLQQPWNVCYPARTITSMLAVKRFNRIDYSFEVVKGWKDDLVSSSDQADGSQQLQHQSLCPDQANDKHSGRSRHSYLVILNLLPLKWQIIFKSMPGFGRHFHFTPARWTDELLSASAWWFDSTVMISSLFSVWHQGASAPWCLMLTWGSCCWDSGQFHWRREDGTSPCWIHTEEEDTDGWDTLPLWQKGQTDPMAACQMCD